MAKMKSTRINILVKVTLLVLFIFRTNQLIEADNKYKESLPRETRIHKIFIVKKALAYLFLVILFTGTIGLLIGFILRLYFPNPDYIFIRILLGVAATTLLWATLAFLGWDIQSYGGVTFTERVNQWIFRSLYCIATLAAIISISWY